MAKVILGVTISLDGFAEDSKGSVGALYPDLDTLRKTDLLQESIRATGSVVMAWKEFAMAEDPDWFAGNYEYQVPIFVFTDEQVLNAGLADDLQIDIIPKFLHNGFRAFERVDENIKLKKIKVVEAGERTSLQFRIGR